MRFSLWSLLGREHDRIRIFVEIFRIFYPRFRVMQSAAISEDDVLPYAEVFSLPLGLYLAWQLGYWFIIEVPSRLCTDKYQY